MLTEKEKNALVFILTWMDEHLDERGVKQAPPRTMIMGAGHGIQVQHLREKGYLVFTRDGLYVTAKALSWWIKTKRGG